MFCSNTKMAEHILSLLISQFDLYYETESYVTPPIKLASCMLTSGGVTTRKEPLANLTNCLQLCLVRQRLLEEGGAEPLPQIQQTSDTLKALADRMSNCEMDDFELVRMNHCILYISLSLPRTSLVTTHLELVWAARTTSLQEPSWVSMR